MRICFRCGHEEELHPRSSRCSYIHKTGERCNCHRFMRRKQRWWFVRIVTCPFHHFTRVMVLVDQKTGMYECPRCKFRRIEEAGGRIQGWGMRPGTTH